MPVTSPVIVSGSRRTTSSSVVSWFSLARRARGWISRQCSPWASLSPSGTTSCIGNRHSSRGASCRPEPECNYRVFDEQGRFLARGDLVYPGYRLFIEYQGDHHRTDRAQWRADIRRIGRLEDHGWQVLQFTDDDLQDPATLVARIALRLRARGAPF